MIGVKFGNKHSYDDWGLILTQKSIGLPDAKTETVDVPGMDGMMDLTEVLSDDVRYGNRKLQFTFQTPKPKGSSFSALLTTIANYMHGKRLQIICDDDRTYYYTGRCEINQFKTSRALATVTIDCDADPYKIRINQNSDWIWDTFSFVDGVISTTEFTVNGTYTAYLANDRRVESPEFTVSADMTVTFEGKTYRLTKGTTTVLDIRLHSGVNIFAFTGNGKVKIYYQGGAL